MLTFDSLLGNEPLKRALRGALAGRFPQSVLLTGPAGIGKLTAARVLAAALLCQRDGDRPCGVCAACRKVESGQHSDVTLIDEGDAEIKVDTARAIRADCAVYPGDGDRRIILIRHAQNMNASAQNALLKLLEEPPSYACFLLMTENSSAILPTILSRCTRFALAPLEEGLVARLMRAQFPDASAQQIAAAAHSCQGIAGDAALVLSQDTGEQVQYADALLRALAAKDEFLIFRAAARCDSLTRAQFSKVLAALRTAVRDATLAASGLRVSPLLPALQDASQVAAQSLTPRQLLTVYDWLGELDSRIERNPGMALLTGCLAAGCYERIRG